jgi:hypothetical protein
VRRRGAERGGRKNLRLFVCIVRGVRGVVRVCVVRSVGSYIRRQITVACVAVVGSVVSVVRDLGSCMEMVTVSI